MNDRGWLVVAALGLALCAVVVSARRPSALQVQADDEESVDLDLSLPAFPMPPKRDMKLLHMDSDAESESDSAETLFRSSAAPRFRSTANEDQDYDMESQNEQADNADEQDEQDEQEEDTETDADEQDEQNGPALLPQYYPSTSNGNAAVQQSADGFVSYQPQSQVHAMRFAQQMNQRFDGLTLPPVPVRTFGPESQQPSAIGDALFTPIHNSERQFAGATPTVNLGASAANYALADRRAVRDAPYSFGVGFGLATNPVNADRYNTQSPRNAQSDLYQAAYHAYTSNPWPSTVSPPSQYYLPPDIVLAR